MESTLISLTRASHGGGVDETKMVEFFGKPIPLLEHTREKG